MHVVQIAQRILQRLERLDDRVAVAGQLCYRLREIAEALRGNARAMRLIDVGGMVDGGEMAPQRLTLFQQPLRENRSEPSGVLMREHSGAIAVQPTRELRDHRVQVARRGECRIGAALPLSLQPLAQPRVPDTLLRVQRRFFLVHPREVHGRVPGRSRCIGHLGETPPSLARYGAAEPRFKRADPTAQPTDGNAEIMQCVVALGGAVVKASRRAPQPIARLLRVGEQRQRHQAHAAIGGLSQQTLVDHANPPGRSAADATQL